MATYTVSGASNDARENVSTYTVNISNTAGSTVSQLNGANHAGFRFTGIAIPKGEAIASAVLNFPELANLGGSGVMTHTQVFGERSANAVTFSDAWGSKVSSRMRTHASVPLGSVPSSPSTFAGIDVTRIVQEIVDQDNWASGNALAIIMMGNGTNSANFIDPWRQNMYPPTLTITTGVVQDSGFPATFTQDTGETWQTNWTNLSNVGANDNNVASANLSLGGAEVKMARFSNFGLDIPPNANINGIEVEMEISASQAAISNLYLMKNNSIVGFNHADYNELLASSKVFTYGNVNDTWGENWTPAELNSTNFGVALQVYNTHGGGGFTLDYVKVTVFYDNPALGFYNVKKSFLTNPSGVVMSTGNQAFQQRQGQQSITNNTGSTINLSKMMWRFAAIETTMGGDPKGGGGGTYYNRTGTPLTVRAFSNQTDAIAGTSPIKTWHSTLKSTDFENYDFYFDSPYTWANNQTIWFVFEATGVSGGGEPDFVMYSGQGFAAGSDTDTSQRFWTRAADGAGGTASERNVSQFFVAFEDAPVIIPSSAFPVGNSEMTVNGMRVVYGSALMEGVSDITAAGYLNGKGSAAIVGDSKMYADRISFVGGSTMTVDGTINPLAITKTYQYKIYDQEWNYLGTWDDVVSNFGYSQEINSAGAAISVTLARNSDTGSASYDVLADDAGDPIVTDDGITIAAETETLNAIGPGTTVDLNLNVKIYEFSSNTLDIGGDLVFTGYISMYTSQYGSTENTVVSIFSYGADLDNYVLMDGNNTRVPYLSLDPSNILANALDRFNADGGIISYFKDSNPLTDNTIEDTNTIVTYTFNANTMFEVIKKCLELAPTDWFFYPDLATNLLHFKPRPSTPDHYFYLGKHVLNLSLEKTMEGITNDVFFTGGKPLYSVLDRFNDIAGTNLSAHTPEKGATWVKHPNSAAGNSLVITNGNRVRGNGSAEGVYYNPTPIPSSDYTVEVNMRIQTLGGNQGIIGRADPSTLTYYLAKVDPPTQKVQLHKCINGTHTLLQEIVLPTGKTLIAGQDRKLQLKMEGAQITVSIDNESFLDIEDRSIITGAYAGIRITTAETNTSGIHLDNFQAGMLNTDNQTQIYKRYIDSSSINTYRRGVERVTDNRVTVEESADVIVASMINRAKDPRYRSSITISGSTYDIRSIKLGDLVGFRNFGNYVDDVTMQVVRIDYTPDAVQLQLDTLLPSVPKRLEDIKRNLNQEQVSDNPDAPDV